MLGESSSTSRASTCPSERELCRLRACRASGLQARCWWHVCGQHRCLQVALAHTPGVPPRPPCATHTLRPDKYETAQAAAFVQALLTHGGFHDEHLEFIRVERVQVCDDG